MKSFRVLFVVALLVAMFASAPLSVKAQQFTSYASGINIQNLNSTTTANISLSYYASGNSDGTGGGLVTSVNDTIAGGGVKNYFPLNVPGPFSGSLVISSDQPAATVTNIGNSTLSALDAYNGSSSGSTTVNLPILHYNNSGFYSWYSVQNAGSSTATVSIDYSSNGVGVDKTIQVAPSASVTVYQNTEGSIHGSVKFFAATLTSAQPIVVSVLQENPNNVFAYTGFNSGSTLPVMPTINMNNSGYFTGTQIYNLGSSSTNVTVTYTAGLFGSNCAETQTIPAKSMVVFTTAAFQGTVAGENCVAGQRFVGGGAVTTNSASQPLVIVVNQLHSPDFHNGASYGGFDPASATNTVYMPTIMERNSGWYTAFNLTNVGSATTFVKCTFAGTSVTQDSGTAGILAGQALTFTQLNQIADHYIGSSVCKTYTNNTYTTVDPNGKIVSVVNELGPGGPDNLLSYEGINGQ